MNDTAAAVAEYPGVRTVGGKLLVHVPQRMENTIVVAGQKLYFDGDFAEHVNKRNLGVVVGCPTVGAGEDYLYTQRAGFGKRMTSSDIQDELALGDIVLLQWTVSEAGNEVGRQYLPEGLAPAGGAVYEATVGQVLARACEGELLPYGSFAFCRPVYPADVEEVQVPGLAGTLHLRVSKSGLTLGTEQVQPLAYQGQVVHVGQSMRGQPQACQVGERVVFYKKACNTHTKLPQAVRFGGQEYLVIRQDYIEAVIREEPTEWELLKEDYSLGRHN